MLYYPKKEILHFSLNEAFPSKILEACMEHIFSIIKKQQSTYSRSFKKISNYFLHDPNLFALKSAAQVGNRVGVSETTIIRFAHHLGFKGFSDLQDYIQQSIFQKSSLSQYVQPKKINKEQLHPVIQFMQQDIANIQHLANQLSNDVLDTVIQKIENADKRLITGIRSSQAMASWFSFTLDLVIGNTRLFQPNVDDVLLRISELTKDSVVIAFSFHRYAAETIRIAKLAQNHGVYVIGITDSPNAPIVEYTNVAIPVQLDVTSTIDTAPVVFSLLNSILSTISLQNKESFQERVKLFDSINGEDFFSSRI